ncbi:uncharacterized protein LOC111041139 [Myzus persicae]|uniref:uncharacterized protein LOC111041139 n=1 Tax=Myzus persicae TaxID=13164 RepID=UPI000B93944F|nr:uncharacterized protein LOC111041139 [Myzus persicae]
MAGSIGNMAKVYKKNFTYVPPAPPADLIDSTSYTLDFAARKFLNVGLDPTDEFNTIVQIITPSRYINMSADFLRHIFSLMGNILSFILDQPLKYKRNLFLETEIISLSSMVYQGENMLVVESNTQAGCRVLLNRTDLMKLKYLEWCVVETVVRKSTIIRPLVLKQFEIIGNYLDQEFTKVDSPPKTPEEMIIFIKNFSDCKIIGSAPKEDMNFISQLKMFATRQLADQWSQRWSGENSPELFTESEMRLISPLSPPQYSSMSPMYNDNVFDPSQAQAADEETSNCFTQINPTQATWVPTKSLHIDDSTSIPPVIIDSTVHDSDNFTQYPLWYNNRVKSTSTSTTQATRVPTKSLNIDDSTSLPPVIIDTLPPYFDPENFAQPPPWYTAPETSTAVDENDGPTYLKHSPSILDFTGGKPTKKRNAKRKLFE